MTGSAVGSNCNNPDSRNEERRGFTLLEIVIAFAILAIAIVPVMKAFSTGFDGLHTTHDHAAAALRALSKIEEVGATIPLREGQWTGRFENGQAWSVRVRPRRETFDREALELGLDLYEIEVTILAEQRPLISLTTIRLPSGL